MKYENDTSIECDQDARIYSTTVAVKPPMQVDNGYQPRVTLDYPESLRYDAYILHVDEDIEFASEIIERMEASGLSICVKERVKFAGRCEMDTIDTIITLIEDKCDRLVVVLSESFFKSEEHIFLLKVAQSIEIQQQKRKIILCGLKSFELPLALTLYTPLFYEPETSYFNFWNRLRDFICDQLDTDTPVPRPRKKTLETKCMDYFHRKFQKFFG